MEVGTFTGYSALCIARGCPQDGHLLCCDVSEEWTSVGRPYWEQAGVADRIELRIAPAVETLRALPHEETIDLAFVDADKPNYAAYYEELLPRAAPERRDPRRQRPVGRQRHRRRPERREPGRDPCVQRLPWRRTTASTP